MMILAILYLRLFVLLFSVLSCKCICWAMNNYCYYGLKDKRKQFPRGRYYSSIVQIIVMIIQMKVCLIQRNDI